MECLQSPESKRSSFQKKTKGLAGCSPKQTTSKLSISLLIVHKMQPLDVIFMDNVWRCRFWSFCFKLCYFVARKTIFFVKWCQFSLTGSTTSFDEHTHISHELAVAVPQGSFGSLWFILMTFGLQLPLVVLLLYLPAIGHFYPQMVQGWGTDSAKRWALSKINSIEVQPQKEHLKNAKLAQLKTDQDTDSEEENDASLAH